MKAAFNMAPDGTLELMVSSGSSKKIQKIAVSEVGKNSAVIFLPESKSPESEWELNPGRLTCEHFRCKKCHFINCVAVKYCGECGSKMKNAGVRPEDLPLPLTEEKHSVEGEATRAAFSGFEVPL